MDMSGIDAVIALRTQFPDARTIVLTTFSCGAEVETALAGGARSYMVGKCGIRIGERVQVLRHYRRCHQYGVAAIPIESVRCAETAVHRSCGNFFEFTGFRISNHSFCEVNFRR